jgi:CRISPR system Cascade subunit CasA
MSRFNLIDEKWIPVRFPDGQRGELGVRDTLLRSKEITAIEDPSPLVVAALHRFLLAVLYRALEGPTDIDQAKALFKEGLRSDKITVYLEKWRDRFWLFDDEYPFYQVPKWTPKEWRSWATLAAEHNADNAKVLFDHLDITNSGSISCARAACWLLACQTFSVGGGNSEFRYTKGAPSASAVMALPVGLNLHDTLVLSMVPENRMIFQNDHPIWEREPDTVDNLKNGLARPISGWADLYTWRTRSVRINTEDEGMTISGLGFASGVVNSSEDFVDPMLAYRTDDKKGKLPIQFRERGLWRDFDSLLPDKSDLAPKVIDHARSLYLSNQAWLARSVIVVGQANNKAKIKYWRMERFILPEALMGNSPIRSEIHQLLVDAESAQNSLWSACRSFARDLIGRGEREPAEKDLRSFVEQMPVSPLYWSALESSFHEILRRYTDDCDLDLIRCQWLKTVRDTLAAAWDQHRASVSMGDAWAIRALVKAEVAVRRKLNELNEEILKLEPKKEDA